MVKLSKSNIKKWFKLFKKYTLQGVAAIAALLAIDLILQHLLIFIVLTLLIGLSLYLAYRSMEHAKFAI